MPAALLMASLQASLRSHYALALEALPRLLQTVNQLLYESTAPEHYATLFFGDYEDATRRLRYANCGHIPPLLVRGNGGIERLTATGTVLGLFEDWQCSVGEAELAPGDMLVVVSDGVSEASSEDGHEFGESGLLEVLRSQAHLDVPGLLGSTIAAVQRFSGGAQADDLTLLIARAVRS